MEANKKDPATEANAEEKKEMTEEEKAEELRLAIEATYGKPIEQTPVT